MTLDHLRTATPIGANRAISAIILGILPRMEHRGDEEYAPVPMSEPMEEEAEPEADFEQEAGPSQQHDHMEEDNDSDNDCKIIAVIPGRVGAGTSRA